MTDTKQLLERAGRSFDPPTDVMGALTARRDRKRRNERLQAGVLGLAIAIAVGWLGVSALRSGPVPADPVPVIPSTPESWSRVQLDPPVDGGEAPGSLVAGPDGLVAIGVHGGPATAWISSDGTTWTRTQSPDLDRADIFDISDIESGGPSFIATGSAVPEGEFDRAIWASEDGVSWNRLPDDPVFGGSFINAIESGGPGLVAVGSRLGAWFSSDGSTWERASVPPVPPEVYPGDDGDAPQLYLTDVADQGDRLVATGWAMLNDNSEVLVVWASRDGRSWTDVPTPVDVFPRGSFVFEITAGPEGFAAVGRTRADRVNTAAIWTSPDGQDWRLHRPGPEGLILDSVAAGNGGYVAVGATMACDTDCGSREAVVMTSVDGETWSRVPTGPEFQVDQPSDPENAQGAAMYDVVAWGSRFAALGEYDGEPTVWVTTPAVQEDVTTPEPPEPSESPEPRPAPAPAGTLAYIFDGDVYVADQDGSNVVKIADGLSDADCESTGTGESYGSEGPMWSPDGRYLAFRSWDCSDPESGGGGVISDAEGNVVARFPREGWEIDWSPDSTRVVVWDVTFETIGVYGLDGARQAQLTMPPEWSPSGDHDPKWMPDGASVRVENWVLPLDGSTPRQWPLFRGDPYATYSPDGSLVAYDGRVALMVVRSDGSDAREVLDDGSSGVTWGHAWSPAGDRIAFASSSGELGVVDIATGTVTRLIERERGVDLQAIGFSPRGDRVLFRKDEGNASSLWSVGADGSDARLVVAGTWQGEWLSP